MAGKFRGLSIWLNGNNISLVHPNAFRGVRNTAVLFLQDNKIAELDDELFANIEYIRHLSLARNHLKCISDKLLTNVQVEFFSFDGNPWHGDCIKKLNAWVSENNVIVSSIEGAIKNRANRIRSYD